MSDPIYEYIQPTSATDSTPIVVRMTRAEILRDYYPRWCERMRRRWGEDVYLTANDCVEDWIAVHWAKEVPRDNEPA